MQVIWQNQLMEASQVKIHMGDRGYQFGDGLYEVIRIYKGRLFMAEEHFDRLTQGAKKIKLKLPYDVQTMTETIYQLIQAEQVDEGYVYIQISRGTQVPRSHAIPKPEDSQPVWTSQVYAYERDHKLQKEGMSAALVPDQRWQHCDIKSLSLLGNILSLEEAKDKGAEDALLYRNGVFTEASASNLWFVKDNRIYTHPDGPFILAGVTKIALRRIIETCGYELVEEAYPVDRVMEADEIFLSNSVWEIVPVNSVDGQEVKNPVPGPITTALQLAYQQLVEDQA
ncbi:TPA: D-amino-acid transaminase [Streptococcus suis]